MTEIETTSPAGHPEPEVKALSRHRLRIALVAVSLLLVGALIGWAGATVFIPPHDVLDSTPFTYVTASNGEVGSTINLNTTAEWIAAPLATNQAQGIVTSVPVTPGQEVNAGNVLYEVNLRPVVIAQGDVPTFRPLSYGATGADVAQLQTLLHSLGFLTGTPDGRFGSATATAVKKWQRSVGVAADGVVETGDLVFVPTLPVRVSLDTDKVRRGAALSGGEDVVRGLAAEPDFSIAVTDVQAVLMPTGTRVEIEGPKGEAWEAYASEQRTDDQGNTWAILLGKDGSSICGDACTEVPPSGQTLLRSKVITLETVSGVVVPTAALLSEAEGTVSVLDADGKRWKVTVIATARGMSVVEGIESGLRIRIPAQR